jgi:outer membrane receptor protein involved in Fe transport
VTWRPSFIKNFRIGIEWEKVGKYWIDELNTREYKGYNLINVRTGYNFSGFSVWLNVLNAANDLYAVRVTKSSYGARTIGYVPGPRRAVFFGMGYRFGGKQR